MVNHWLFQVMHEHFPTLWDESLRYSVAAQHYPPGWTREAPNVDLMHSMKSGDKIIAAFKGHRFAGYGVLTSDFKRGGPPLNIKSYTGKRLTFAERFDCDWRVIPLHRNPSYITCHDLKKSGFAIDLMRGHAIQPIAKETFGTIKARLDAAGAATHRSTWVVKAREVLGDKSAGWHWREYFNGADNGRSWGGPDWVQSNLSKQLLRDCVGIGDIVVMYQQDDSEHGRAILGFTRMVSDGKEFRPGSGDFNCFDLADVKETCVLKNPLKISSLRSTGISPACFKRGTQGTLFPVCGVELRGIIHAVVRNSPDDADNFLGWLEDVGVQSRSLEGGSSYSPVPNDEWDRGCSAKNVDAMLDEIERRMRKKTDVYIKRLVRQWVRQDRPLIRALKEKYAHSCQFPGCTAVIPMQGGLNYCEVAHITAVAKGGEAVRINLVVLCPNHHKMFDHGTLTIEANNRLAIKGTLNGSRFTIRR